MTVKQLTATLEGNMRFTAVNAAGRTLVMDDYEGGGGPSPIETVLASLAGCTGMDVVSILRKKRVPFTAYHVETTADQKDTYPQVFTRMDVVPRGRGRGDLGGRGPPGRGAVGAQVLPGVARCSRRGRSRSTTPTGCDIAGSLHEYAVDVYSHSRDDVPPDLRPLEPAARERPRAPVSADSTECGDRGGPSSDTRAAHGGRRAGSARAATATPSGSPSSVRPGTWARS